MIDRTSRYAKVETAVAVDPTGGEVELLQLRLAPETTGVYTHTPQDGDRLDLLAHKFLKDSRKFWRICDAQDQLDPFDVIAPGQPLVIPPPR